MTLYKFKNQNTNIEAFVLENNTTGDISESVNLKYIDNNFYEGISINEYLKTPYLVMLFKKEYKTLEELELDFVEEFIWLNYTLVIINTTRK